MGAGAAWTYICKKKNTGQHFTLGKDERLKSRKLIDRVFREGKSFALFPFRVYYAPLPPWSAAGAASPVTSAAMPGAAAGADSAAAAAKGTAAVAKGTAAAEKGTVTAIAPVFPVVDVAVDAAAPGAIAAAAAPIAAPAATTGVLAGVIRKASAAPALRLQAGFGASSRNFKKAVDRNRIKRLTREAYRLQKHTLQAWLQEKDRSLALFFIYTGKELPDYEVVKEKVGLALQKLMKEPGS